MKTLHSLIAGLRPAHSILAGRIAIPLLLLTAGMVVLQPCARQTGTWPPTGTLGPSRATATATLPPNVQAHVAVGYNTNAGGLASAELYDPARGTWMATGSLITARFGPTATLLPNGQVLVAGGGDDVGDSLA